MKRMHRLFYVFVFFAPLFALFANDERLFSVTRVPAVMIAFDRSGSMNSRVTLSFFGSVDLHKYSGGNATELDTWYDSLTVPDNGSMDDFNGMQANGYWELGFKHARGVPKGTLHRWELRLKINNVWHTYQDNSSTSIRSWMRTKDIYVPDAGLVQDVQVYVRATQSTLSKLYVKLSISQRERSTRMKEALKVIFDLLDANNDFVVDTLDEKLLPITLSTSYFLGCPAYGLHPSTDPIYVPNRYYKSVSGYALNPETWKWEYQSSHIFYTDTLGSHFGAVWAHMNNDYNNGYTPNGPLLQRSWQYLNNYDTTGAYICYDYSIIFITDGESNRCFDYSDCYDSDGYSSTDGSKEFVRQAYKAYHQHGIKVYAVGFGTGISQAGANDLNWVGRWGGTHSYAVSDSVTGDTMAIKPWLGCNAMGTPRYTNLSGYAFIAEDATALANALERIFEEILSSNYSFSGIAITSIQEEFLATQYQSRMYLASFLPGDTPLWDGHLKALRLPLNTISFSLDSIPDSLLIWDAGDTLRVTDPSSRNIYGVKNEALEPFDSLHFSPSDLDVSTYSEVSAIVNLVRSGSPSPVDTSYLGDIFHSAPLRIHIPNVFYEDDDFWKFRVDMQSGRNPAVYVGANDGMLHCFDDSTGDELWAIIPNDQLPRLKNLALAHTYYIDASPQAADVWFPSEEADSFKNSYEWKTVLMFGERDGGRGYTAIDVTYPTSPNYLFEFTNDSLGYTWSEPRIFKVNRICRISSDTVERFMGFFGGGFWPDSLWNTLTDPGDIPGNSIYALDIYEMSEGNNDQWWNIPPASGFHMNWPFPAAPTLFNRNPESDNIYDVMYIGDMDGQVWKVDLSDPDPENWEARVIFRAKQPDDSTDYDHWQPIFYPITVVKNGQNTWLLFGTGDRANVLRTGTLNRFYAVLDTTPVSGAYITESQLKKVSPDGYLTAGELMHNYRGWYIKFSDYSGNHNGEKVVTYATAFLDTVTFMTYRPNVGIVTDPCAIGAGFSRLYKFQITSGRFNGALPYIEMGQGLPQAPKYNFNMSGEGIEINHTSGKIEIQKRRTIGALKKLLWWKEY